MPHLYTLTPLPMKDILYQPNLFVNDQILADTNILSNWKYRQYIQHNGNQIMKYNTMESIYNSGTNPYMQTMPIENKSKTPYFYTSTFDVNTISQPQSDLKQHYIAKEMIKARMISPNIK